MTIKFNHKSSFCPEVPYITSQHHIRILQGALCFKASWSRLTNYLPSPDPVHKTHWTTLHEKHQHPLSSHRQSLSLCSSALSPGVWQSRWHKEVMSKYVQWLNGPLSADAHSFHVIYSRRQKLCRSPHLLWFKHNMCPHGFNVLKAWISVWDTVLGSDGPFWDRSFLEEVVPWGELLTFLFSLCPAHCEMSSHKLLPPRSSASSQGQNHQRQWPCTETSETVSKSMPFLLRVVSAFQSL